MLSRRSILVGGTTAISVAPIPVLARPTGPTIISSSDLKSFWPEWRNLGPWLRSGDVVNKLNRFMTARLGPYPLHVVNDGRLDVILYEIFDIMDSPYYVAAWARFWSRFESDNSRDGILYPPIKIKDIE